MSTTLSVEQVRAARMLGQGRLSQKQVAEMLKINPGTLSIWSKIPEFRRIVTAHAERHADLIGAMLLEGELEATAALREALTANDKEGNPYWRARLQAADSLLDRRGERGKPAEKMQAQILNQGGNLAEALRAALRDPAVRQFVQSQPHLAKAIPAEVVEVATVDVRPEGS